MTAEQIAADPNFADNLRGIQNYVRVMQNDLREKFHVCLHEGGNAMRIRACGEDVEYHRPYVRSMGDSLWVRCHRRATKSWDHSRKRRCTSQAHS